MAFFNERLLVKGLRWTARIIGVALLGLVAWVAILAIKEGGLNPLTLSLQDRLAELAIWTMTLGLLIGWKWEGIGGLLVLGGVAFLGVVDYQSWPQVQTVAGLVTGLLYLACWWRTRRSTGDGEMELGAVTRIMKRFQIPLVLVLGHATFVALTGIEVALYPDPEGGMIWLVVSDLDYPISRCIDSLPLVFSSNRLFAWTLLALGTVQWGIVGLVLQGIVYSLRQVVRWFRR